MNDFFLRSPSEKARRYCSKQCQYDALRVKKVKWNCKLCNKELETVPSHVGECCSRKCRGIASRIIQDPSLRRCFICKEIKQMNNFGSAGKERISYICKICCQDRTRKRFRTPRGRFTASKTIAKIRKMEWTISEVKYCELRSQKCYYCLQNLNPTGTGLDRIDNKKGYTLENVVPCCCDCNRTRSDIYSHEEMLILAETIKTIKAKRIQSERK